MLSGTTHAFTPFFSGPLFCPLGFLFASSCLSPVAPRSPAAGDFLLSCAYCYNACHEQGQGVVTRVAGRALGGVGPRGGNRLCRGGGVVGDTRAGHRPSARRALGQVPGGGGSGGGRRGASRW